MSELCACGKPLHYTDPSVRATVEALIANLGENVKVTTPQGTWSVQRHWIALHGLNTATLPHLARQLGFPKDATPRSQRHIHLGNQSRRTDHGDH